jgi:acyl-CoA oxidase
MSNRLTLLTNHLSTPTYLSEPLDFLKLDSLLPPDLNQHRLKLRKLFESEFAPSVSKYVEEAKFPFEYLPKLKGLLGLKEAKYGCRAISEVEKNLTLFELARIDGSLASFYAVAMSLVIFTIERLGSEEQKARYLPGLVNLETIGCWGLTEPNHGSDASSIETTATPVDGGFVINGEKRWIGNAIMSDIMIIWARNTQTKQVQGFIIPTKTEGVKVENIERKLALRIIQNGHIYLRNVKIPINNRLEKAKNFADGVNIVLESSRIAIPWIATGIMAGIYENSIKYAVERKQFGAPLAAFQLNQEKLVKLLGYFQSAFLMTWRITELSQKGLANVARVSLIKAWVSLIGRDAARFGRELMGGNGILIDRYVMRALNDMEAVYTYEGTYDTNVLVVGRAITGISAFKSPYKSNNE